MTSEGKVHLLHHLTHGTVATDYEGLDIALIKKAPLTYIARWFDQYRLSFKAI